jgi:hypothetical protein
MTDDRAETADTGDGPVPSPPPRGGRRRRRARRIALAAAGGSLLALVATAPTLLSMGLGAGLVRRALEKRVNGTADFERLSLSWLGSQSISGLTVTESAGRRALDLDVEVRNGLLSFLLGGPRRLEVSISGAIAGEIRPDGTVSFRELLAAPSDAEPAARQAGQRPPLRGIPAIDLRVEGLAISLEDRLTGRTIALDRLEGAFGYEPGGDASLKLASPLSGAEEAGLVSVSGRLERLFDGQGRVTPGGAAASLDLELIRLPVPLSPRPMTITMVKATARSSDLTDRLTLSMRAEALLDGSPGGTLAADLSVLHPIAADGSLDASLDGLTGTISAAAMPTGILQPFLTSTPISIARDVGPTIDLDARFSAGGGNTMEIRAASDAIRLEMAGRVDPAGRTLRGQRLLVDAAIAPALLAEAGIEADEPARLRLESDRFALPPEPAEATFRGRLALAAPLKAALAGRTAQIAIESFALELDSEALAHGATVRGSATVEGSPAFLELAVSGLLDEHGAPRPQLIEPLGMLSVRKVEPTTLARLVPGRAALIEAAGTGPVDLTLQTARSRDGVDLTGSAVSPGLEARLFAHWRPGDETVQVERSRAELTLTPQLVATLQEGSAAPIVLAAPARVTAALQPVSVPWRALGGAEPMPRVALRVTAEELPVASAPGLAAAVAASSLVAEITADGGADAPALTLNGQARLRTWPAGEALADARLTAATSPGAAEPIESAELSLTAIDVARLERVAGVGTGELSDLLGGGGGASVRAERRGGNLEAAAVADLARLTGRFGLRIDERAISASAERPRMSLGRGAIQRRLQPDGGSRDPAGTVLVESDLPLALEVRSLRLPRAILEGGGIDSGAADIDLELTGGPLVLGGPAVERVSVQNMKLALRSDSLARGVDLSVRADVDPGGPRPGRLRIDGRATGLVGEGRLSPATAAFDLSLDARSVPTALLDAMAGMDGLLVAALGPRLEGEATARSLSFTTGTLEARLATTNGSLSLWAAGREGALVVPESKPLAAQLEITPPLRQRLLARIHPLLADIRTTEQPLRATVRSASVPFGGAVAGLNADLEMTIGRVEFDSGSITLALLAAFNASNAATIPGEIEPIVARIRKGVVTYERFAVRIDKYTLVYSGSMDLNTRTVDLRTEIPLEGLARSIEELRGYAEYVTVPIVMRGPFDQARPELDPDFDVAAAIAEAGARGALDEALDKAARETGVPVRDILDTFFGKKKGKKDQEKP